MLVTWRGGQSCWVRSSPGCRWNRVSFAQLRACGGNARRCRSKAQDHSHPLRFGTAQPESPSPPPSVPRLGSSARLAPYQRFLCSVSTSRERKSQVLWRSCSGGVTPLSKSAVSWPALPHGQRLPPVSSLCWGHAVPTTLPRGLGDQTSECGNQTSQKYCEVTCGSPYLSRGCLIPRTGWLSVSNSAAQLMVTS